MIHGITADAVHWLPLPCRRTSPDGHGIADVDPSNPNENAIGVVVGRIPCQHVVDPIVAFFEGLTATMVIDDAISKSSDGPSQLKLANVVHA